MAFITVKVVTTRFPCLWRSQPQIFQTTVKLLYGDWTSWKGGLSPTRITKKITLPWTWFEHDSKWLCREGSIKEMFTKEDPESCQPSPGSVSERQESSHTTDRKIWIIPHHGAYHPKKPNKIWVVLDCSAELKGKTLNKHLLQGPDLTFNLLHILFRFRQKPGSHWVNVPLSLSVRRVQGSLAIALVGGWRHIQRYCRVYNESPPLWRNLISRMCVESNSFQFRITLKDIPLQEDVFSQLSAPSKIPWVLQCQPFWKEKNSSGALQRKGRWDEPVPERIRMLWEKSQVYWGLTKARKRGYHKLSPFSGCTFS